MITQPAHNSLRYGNGLAKYRITLLIALFALISVSVFSVSLASLRGLGSKAPVAKTKATNSRKTSRGKLGLPNAGLNLLLPQSTSPSISTFDGTGGGCGSAKSTFNLGQEVCAQVTNTGGAASRRRITWTDPEGNVRQSTPISTDPQSDNFPVPATATTTLSNGQVVKNVGTWRVALVARSLVTFTTFVVKDPANAAADLSITKVAPVGSQEVPAGANGSFDIYVQNGGPDDAATVSVVDHVPANTTFVSLVQTGGQASAQFTCATLPDGGGNVTCSTDSLPTGATATFSFIYTVNAGTATGTVITNNVSIASATTAELNSADNSASASASVSGTGGGGTCSVACPDDISTPANTVDQNNNPGAIVHFSPPSGNEECGVIVVDHCNDCFFPQGSTVVTATAAGGASCSFTVTVTPTGAATTVSCPSDKSGNADGNCNANISVGTATGTGTNVTFFATRSDGEPVYTCDDFGNCTRNSSDAPFTYGVTTITWYAFSHDVAGPYDATSGDEESHRSGTATCTQTITVNDVTAPVIGATNSSASADANCQAPVPDYSSTVTDNCSSNITFTQTPAAGTLVGLGSHTIHLEANDNSTANSGAGNSSSKDVTFTVNDTTPPTVTAPADSSASAGANCQAAVPDYTAGSTASDNCDSSVTLTQSPAAGTLVGAGPHTVTVTATDDAGNQSSDDVVFTVNDTTAPTVTAPADSSASADANCQAPVPDYTANSTASDDCDSSLTLTQSPAAGTLVGMGPHTVTVTATDDAGNHSSDDVVFTVNDTTAPTVTAPADSSASADANCQAPVPNYVAGTTASDNCDGSVTLTQSPAAGTMVGKGPHTVTVTGTDDSGNQGTDTVIFTVNDTTAPAISCPANITRSNDPGMCSANINPGTATATDNCDTPTITGTRSDGGPLNGSYPVGTTTITWTAVDSSNNTSSCTQTITVNDTESPVISCPSSQTLEPTCPSGAIGNWTAPVGTDNCPGAVTTRTAGPAPGSTFAAGTTTTITYTVNDAHGNSTSCSFTITVKSVLQTLDDLRASVAANTQLNGTQKNGLLSKLDAAKQHIQNNNQNGACSKLADFVNSVQNFISHGDLSASTGNAWISTANNIRNAFGCTNNPCT